MPKGNRDAHGAIAWARKPLLARFFLGFESANSDSEGMGTAPPYRLEIEPAAAKGLKTMPAKDGQALLTKLEEIAAAPFATRGYVTKLQGRPAYRVRHGNWRAIYAVDRAIRVMLVTHVGHRREIYRR